MDLEDYHVKTEVFEGPLDVLLSLIEKRKLLINDISLAKVADDYIAYIRGLESLPISDTAQFVLIASTLILIKSKSLLPNLELSAEEEQTVSDLEERLRLRQKYKELSKHIRSLFGTHKLFAALEKKSIHRASVFAPDRQTTTAVLCKTIKSIIAALPVPEKLAKATVQKVISLEEMIVSLTDRISKSFKMSFKDLNKKGADKVEVIVSFLAILELVKQGIVAVRQDQQFQNIEMEATQLSTPRY